jgi:uncharacterized protein
MEQTFLHRYDDEFLAFIASKELRIPVNRKTGAALGLHERGWRLRGDADVAWQPASGQGVLLSYTVTRRAYAPDFPVPLVHGLIELAEGPRLVCRVQGVTPEAVTCDMALAADFDDRGLVFRPARGGPAA